MPTTKKPAKKEPVKKTTAKKAVRTATAKTPAKPKLITRLKQRAADYRAKRPHRSFKRTRWANRRLGGKPVASITDLLLGTFKVIWREKRIVLGLALLYGVVNFLVLGAIDQTDYVDLKDQVVQVLQGNFGAVGNVVVLFNSTLGGILNQPLSELQSVLGFLFGFLLWLMLVWALRMRFANEKITIRDALYNASSPLISSIFVASAIAVQLLPAGIAAALMVLAQQIGALQGIFEYLMFGAVAALFVTLSIYWVVSSLVALIIVTLPGMYPWQALSNASVLVIGQRWKIILRIAVLGVALVLTWVVVLFPVIALDGWLRFDWLPLVPATVQALAAFSLTYFAVYVYRLYRSLL